MTSGGASRVSHTVGVCQRRSVGINVTSGTYLKRRPAVLKRESENLKRRACHIFLVSSTRVSSMLAIKGLYRALQYSGIM